jgi:O-antigen/teichoic acid export membrane protein
MMSAKNDKSSGKLVTFLKQSIMTFAVTGLVFLIRIIKNIVISRLLGPSLRGVFAMVILIPEMIVSLGNLGFGPAAVYYTLKEKWDLNKVMGICLIFTFLSGIVLAPMGYVYLHWDIFFLKDILKIQIYTPFILGAVLLLIGKNLNLNLLMAISRIHAYNMVRTAESILPLIFFLAIWCPFGYLLEAAVWSWFAGLVIVMFMTYFLLRNTGAYPPRFSKVLLKKCIGYGLLSHPANFMQIALLRSDFFFISAMMGTNDLGYYAVASSTAELLLTLPQSIGVPFVPLALGMDKKEAQKYTPQIIRLICCLMVIACLIMGIAGDFLIRMFFGEEFLPATRALTLLLPGMAALSIYPMLKIELFGQNMPGRVSAVTGIALVINLSLNWLLIPVWGITGAALSSSVAYIISVGLLLITYCRLNHLPISIVLIPQRSDWVQIRNAIRQKQKKWTTNYEK